SLVVLAPLAALTQVCTANFDIYRTEDRALVGGVATGWDIHPGHPSCDAVRSSKGWYDSGDVSGNKKGINCVGSCKFEDRVDGISRFEMHFSNNPLYHWSEFSTG